MKENEIKSKIEDYRNKINELEKHQKQIRIEENKSIYCSKCNRFIVEPGVDEFKTRICFSCVRDIERQKQRKSILDKLKGAKIIDVDLSKCNSIESITFYKNKIMFEILARGDYDEAYFSLSETDARHIEDVEIELKPCDKPRVERPIESYLKGTGFDRMTCPKCGKEMEKLGDTGFVACIDCNVKEIKKIFNGKTGVKK